MIPKVKAFDVYKSYLGLKNHFTKKTYDYHKYCGKSRASIQSFYKRRDRFFFEKLSRQKDDSEVIEYFVANFVSCDDPQGLWIGQIMKEGESNYSNWKRKNQSMSYVFKNEVSDLFENKKFDDVFYIDGSRHPIIVKEHLANDVSLETLIILDRILGFKKNFDKKLKDPVWEFLSMRIDKYSPFIHTDIFSYKRILKEVVGIL